MKVLAILCATAALVLAACERSGPTLPTDPGDTEPPPSDPIGQPPSRETQPPLGEPGPATAGIIFGGCRDERDDSPTGACAVFVIDADGSNLRQVTTPLTLGELDPVWSPDGRRIAFSSFRHCYPVSDSRGWCGSDIYVANADGSGLQRVVRGEGATVSHYYPTWSPDSRRIAFQKTTFGGTPIGAALTVEIFLVDLDGWNLTRLPGSEGALAPRWSPDGKRIAFHREGDIHVMDPDGSNPRQLTYHPEYDGNVAWSPDGNRIAFGSQRDDNHDIYVMNEDGSNLVRLTHHTAYDTGPDWSPDGSQIAFLSGRDEGGLYVMNADGTGVTRLFAWDSNLQWTTTPSWSHVEP